MKDTNPLYQQIYDSIKKRIENDYYKKDELLPSELDLQKEYNVSRITVRRALQELEFAGLVYKVHGKGTFVESKKTYSNLVGASSFSAEASSIGERSSSIILDFKEEKSSMIVSEYLQIPVDSDIYFLKRLRLKNGKIVGLHETYISKLDGFTIDEEEINEKTSIYNLYEKKGFKISRATETIESKMPNRQTKTELFMKDGEPVFIRERITYIENDIPIEFSINTYRADMYKYVINLSKDIAYSGK